MRSNIGLVTARKLPDCESTKITIWSNANCLRKIFLERKALWNGMIYIRMHVNKIATIKVEINASINRVTGKNESLIFAHAFNTRKGRRADQSRPGSYQPTSQN